MESYDIKLIKYGILFFYDSATIKYSSSVVEVTKLNGVVAFSYAPSDIKKVDFNGNSGIFTLKTYTGQKVNISFKGDFTLREFEPVTKFRAFLKKQNIKGLTIH